MGCLRYPPVILALPLDNKLNIVQFITFDDWDRSRAWAAHIAGATALLQLRGQKQFDSELGAQLFQQLRSQMVRVRLPAL